MGQKSNPNSIQVSNKNPNIFPSNCTTLGYSVLLKEQLKVSTNLISFFEKRNCIVKDCFFILNNEKSFVTIFINFLVLKKRVSKFKSISPKIYNDSQVSFTAQKFLKVLTQFGYCASKRLVFQNLNKIALDYQRTIFFNENLRIRKALSIFKSEIYFEPAIFLFCLLNVSKNSSILFSKFISRFFRILHKTKKINKFLLFLTKFVNNTDNLRFNSSQIKGLKIQIKGRFNGVPRSKTRVFEKGSIPLQTISTNINYSLTHVNTSYGVFGVKVWVFE